MRTGTQVATHRSSSAHVAAEHPADGQSQRHKRAHIYTLIGMFIAVAYLGYTGLSRTYFWDDEAHVAIIAKNVLATGQLTAWDGRNLHAYRNGMVLNEHLRQMGPPLDSIVVAASFWLFGVSTWAARFPFVIAGLVGLAIFVRLLRYDFGTAPQTWLYALMTLGFSPVFLLNIRQSRYYALAIVFSLLAFYAYRRCLATTRWRYFVVLAAAAALLFYSNYFLCAAFLLALGLVHGVFYARHVSPRFWAKAAAAAGLFALSTLPYLRNALHYPDLGHGDAWLWRRGTLLWWNVRELNLLGCLPWTIALGLTFCLLRYRKTCASVRTAWQWIIFSLSYVGFVALFSPQPTTVPTIADVRYLIIAVPFLAGLVGLFFHFVHRRSPLVAGTVLGVMVTSNLLTLTPSTPQFRWLLPAYIGEIHRAYPTAYEAVSDYLRTHARQDDLVFTYPEFTHPPLLFYVGDRVRLCCLLNRKTPLPMSTLKRLQAPLLIEQHFPTWFVAFGNHADVGKLLQYFSRPHQQDNRRVQYRYPLVDILDVYWAATQRPELPWHHFGPKTDFNRRAEAVYIFKRSRVEPDASDPTAPER